MTVKEAVEYCESHECEECPVYKGKCEDRRTKYEKEVLQMACCLNLAGETE